MGDKRLCHSCKHICFFSAVCCECSDNKVSCLRHSHYMCRCAITRKYILIWTPESEMRDIISKVEARGEELDDAGPDEQTSASSHTGALVALVDAPDAAKDRLFHQTYDVPVCPICPLDVPELVSSDTSICSSKSQSSGAPKNPLEGEASGLPGVASSIVTPTSRHPCI